MVRIVGRDGGLDLDALLVVGTAWWRPLPETTWQWQLTDEIDTSIDVAMYDVDLFDVPQAVVDSLHAEGRVVVCYFSAGSWERWRPDADDFPDAVLGANNG